MALSHKQVLPTVIVIVDELTTPSRVRPANETDAGSVGYIVKAAIALSKQSVFLAAQGINKDVGLTIVVIIGEIETHAGEGHAVAVVGQPGSDADLLER